MIELPQCMLLELAAGDAGAGSGAGVAVGAAGEGGKWPPVAAVLRTPRRRPSQLIVQRHLSRSPTPLAPVTQANWSHWATPIRRRPTDCIHLVTLAWKVSSGNYRLTSSVFLKIPAPG